MTVALQDQLDWEHEMIYRGVQRFRTQQQEAVEGGRETETSAGSRLLRSYVLQISEHISDFLTGKLPGRRRSKYAKLLDGISTDVIAMFTLRHLLGAAFVPAAKGIPTQAVCLGIGGMLEDELRFSAFETEYLEYYAGIIRRLDAGHTKNYRHMHRNLVDASNKKGVGWHSWSHSDKVHVGSVAVALAMEACDLLKLEQRRTAKKGYLTYVVPTEQCLEWINKHDAFAELITPDRMPCLIPPADWITPADGGFWSPRLRDLTPLIKNTARSGGITGERKARINAAVMPGVLSAVNALQETPWRLNQPVIDVMRQVWQGNLGIGMPRSEPYEIPPSPVGEDDKPKDWAADDPRRTDFLEWKAAAREIHSMERERVAQNRALIRTMRLASELQDKEKFYYAFTCDFRGRTYCATTGLSPQGTDHSKSLLQFARTEPIGERGMHWLKIHGANKFGYDKVSYDDRVVWIDRQHDLWRAIAADPLEHRSHWGGCDKPWQFLAWCNEYKAATDYGPGFRSSLPIALDGSCNGLQHFSAMLRDPVGGRAVNLLGGDVPADIYQQVADVCTRKLRGLRSLNTKDHTGASNWLSLFASLGEEAMPRSLSKKPVMTLPYGSTQQACTSSIFRWLTETAPKFFDKGTSFRHSLYLTPILWSSISEVVVAARAAMDWVQTASSIMAKNKQALDYTSALGFPVYQAAQKFDLTKICTQIGGRLDLKIATSNGQIDVKKQRQGSSPNLIHHIDATHLMMTVNAAVAEDIDCFSMIHDDFGCHAGRVDTMQRIIRKTFVELHSDNLLEKFKVTHEELYGITLPDLPASGDLDIKQVLHSPYFFG